MSDDKKNKTKGDILREEILDSFPGEMLPGFEPKKIDVTNSSYADIINASGVRQVIDKAITDPNQRTFTHKFLDELIDKHSPSFERIRDALRDEKFRMKLLTEMAKRSKQ